MNISEQDPMALSRIEAAVHRMETLLMAREQRQALLYRSVLNEAVEVLRQTKNAFHSSQIRDLRQRMEAALKH